MNPRNHGSAQIIRANALDLPLADDSVDLVVTSPPYFALRSYQDGGEHYDGQIGSEPTPAEFLDALIAATREMVRVTKPCGSIWVNLGDKYAGSRSGPQGESGQRNDRAQAITYALNKQSYDAAGTPPKSLMGIPWRYAIRCIDELGLILRAEVIWSKPNGLPESVTDRVRRSHEQWFHFSLQPRYFSGVDEIREPHAAGSAERARAGWKSDARMETGNGAGNVRLAERADGYDVNPLGKLPGSVWTVATEPLKVPDHLGIDHFAAFPTEWPRRIIQGWSPTGICTVCGEGRRPEVAKSLDVIHVQNNGHSGKHLPGDKRAHQLIEDDPIHGATRTVGSTSATITGYACACPEPTARITPAVVLDPFGGTGTTALVAKALGRTGISIDLSADYCRLATWRTTDPDQIAKAARKPKPPRQLDGQLGFNFDGDAA